MRRISLGLRCLPSTNRRADLLTLANVLGADAAAYNVVVTNSRGSVTSTPPTTLTVRDPVILTQPVSRTNHAGTTAIFSVAANGTQPFISMAQNRGLAA